MGSRVPLALAGLLAIIAVWVNVVAGVDPVVGPFPSTSAALGQKTMAGSASVVIASDQSALPISGTITTTPPANASVNVTQFGGNNVVTGAGASGAGIPRVTVSSDSAVTANAGTNLNTSALLLDATFTGRINTQGQKTMAASTPVVTASDQSGRDDATASATLAAANATVTVAVNGYQGVGFQLDAGTLTALIVFEVSYDSQTSWLSFAIIFAPDVPGNNTNAVSVTNPNALTHRAFALSGGETHARARVLTYTSGSAVGRLRATTIRPNLLMPVLQDGIGSGTQGVSVSGVDGTTLSRQLQLRNVVPAGTTYGAVVRPLVPQYTRSDTYTTTASGTTVDATAASPKAYGIQCTATGAVTSWDARLEGSLDNTTFTQILAHTNVTGTGVTVWSAANLSPSLYIRSRAAGLVLGAGTNVICVILGVQ